MPFSATTCSLEVGSLEDPLPLFLSLRKKYQTANPPAANTNNSKSIKGSLLFFFGASGAAGATTGSSAYVYIKVKIHDPGKNGEYSGELHWILEPVTNE